MAERDVSKYELHARLVSAHVIQILQLPVGDQDCLIAMKRILRWKSDDPVLVAARALKEISSVRFVKYARFCYDDSDEVVYCVVDQPGFAHLYRGYAVNVHQDNVTFLQVKSIVVRPMSYESFLAIFVMMKAPVPMSSDENKDVSLFVTEYLGLTLGDQSRLLCANGLIGGDFVKLVARVLEADRGNDILSSYKICLDSLSGIVYLLAPDANEAERMAGRSFVVQGVQEVSFYRVMKIEQWPHDVDVYQFCQCFRLWPLPS